MHELHDVMWDRTLTFVVSLYLAGTHKVVFWTTDIGPFLDATLTFKPKSILVDTDIEKN